MFYGSAARTSHLLVSIADPGPIPTCIHSSLPVVARPSATKPGPVITTDVARLSATRLDYTAKALATLKI